MLVHLHLSIQCLNFPLLIQDVPQISATLHLFMYWFTLTGLKSQLICLQNCHM